jgi:hypothetical protein
LPSSLVVDLGSSGDGPASVLGFAERARLGKRLGDEAGVERVVDVELVNLGAVLGE